MPTQVQSESRTWCAQLLAEARGQGGTPRGGLTVRRQRDEDQRDGQQHLPGARATVTARHAVGHLVDAPMQSGDPVPRLAGQIAGAAR